LYGGLILTVIFKHMTLNSCSSDTHSGVLNWILLYVRLCVSFVCRKYYLCCISTRTNWYYWHWDREHQQELSTKPCCVWGKKHQPSFLKVQMCAILSWCWSCSL
jgi:hypothetical protein